MASISFLSLLCVCLYLVCGAFGQQCEQQIEDFHKCIFDSLKKPGGNGKGHGQGDRPNFEDLKNKAEKCFTDNNCEAPKLPSGPPPPGSGGPGKGQGQGQGQGPRGNGPFGGRAGRVDSGANDDRRKCFETISNKTKDYMLSCMRKADPSFSFPGKHDFGGDHRGPGGPGGHGGPPHGFGGPHPGGQGGPGGHEGPHPGGPGGHGPGGQQFLLAACKNNADAASKVNACLANAFPRPQLPNKNQMSDAIKEHCDAKKACEAKLGQCKDVLEKRQQAMCQCGQDVASKHQEFMQQEPACSTLSQKQASPQRQPPKHDCSEKPRDPCA